jgi:cation transport ATPase
MEKIQLNISGISCLSCVSKIEKSLYSNKDINQVSINQETGETEISSSVPIPSETLNQLIEDAGDYKISATKSISQESSKNSYKPLILVVSFLLLTTLLVELSSGMFLLETWMPNFMAGFFIVFSFFKFLDLKGFANAYQSYDIIAARIKGYGYVYPFIELGLGCSYILYSDLSITHAITAIVMFVSLIGVVKSVLNKTKIKCACLGTGFNLPMSYVTIIEDAVMLIMALFMYFKI